MTDFREDFIHQLQTGAEALEDAGYDVLGYQGEILSRETAEVVVQNGDTPEEALDNTLEEIDSDQAFSFYFGGDEFREAITGDRDPESLVYRNMTGLVEIDEPDVPENYGGTEIKYIPGTENQWEVNTYDLEDGQERAENAAEALKEFGLEAEVGHIHQ